MVTSTFGLGVCVNGGVAESITEVQGQVTQDDIAGAKRTFVRALAEDGVFVQEEDLFLETVDFNPGCSNSRRRRLAAGLALTMNFQFTLKSNATTAKKVMDVLETAAPIDATQHA